MTMYARWPKSVWYVYDAEDFFHVMSLNHMEDAPLRIPVAEIGVFDIEYIVEKFPGCEDAEIDELLSYVNAFASTMADKLLQVAPTPAIEPVVKPEPVSVPTGADSLMPDW